MRTWRRGGRTQTQAPGSHTPSVPAAARLRSAPNQGPADGQCPPPPRLTACVLATGGPRGRPRGVGPVLRWPERPLPRPPASSRLVRPPRPSGPASYLHGPDQAPAGQLALPQLQQNVSGPRPAAPSAPSRHRCRRPSPSAGPRPSSRRRRRHIASSDKQEASCPRAAETSTGRQRGRRSAPSGPSVEAQAAWQGLCAPRRLLGNVVLASDGAGAVENFAASVAFPAPGCDILRARSPRSRTSPACALSHFSSVVGRYSQLAWGRTWAPGQESSLLEFLTVSPPTSIPCAISLLVHSIISYWEPIRPINNS